MDSYNHLGSVCIRKFPCTRIRGFSSGSQSHQMCVRNRAQRQQMYSPPRRIHPRRENEQEQNEYEVYLGDGSGVMLAFRPMSDPHSPAAVR